MALKISYNAETSIGNAKDETNNIVRIVTPKYLLSDFKHIVLADNGKGGMTAFYDTGLIANFENVCDWKDVVKNLDLQIGRLTDRTDIEKKLLYMTLHNYHGIVYDIMIYMVDEMTNKLVNIYLQDGINITT